MVNEKINIDVVIIKGSILNRDGILEKRITLKTMLKKNITNNYLLWKYAIINHDCYK